MLGACISEATAPEAGGGMIGQVVPLAVPDAWCPAVDSVQDTTAAENTPRAACDRETESAPVWDTTAAGTR
jgi:hypothetical protein